MGASMSDNNKTNNKGMDVLVPGHDYDGIQEFNNPAPFWWQLFFYISIAFGVGYFAYYQIMGGPTLKDELNERLAKIKAAQPQGPAGPDAALLSAALADPAKLAVGQKVFAEKCAPCHAPDGGGLVGPNLTDNYWIHGKGTLVDIYTVVQNGVPDKGMLAWGPLLSPEELVGVVAYVKSLKGKPVANAKAPQGDLVSE